MTLIKSARKEVITMKITGNIEKLLEAAQKNTRERRLTLDQVQEAAQNCIAYLHGKGIAYCAMAGIKATLNPYSQHFANSYRGIPYSTQIDIEFTASTCKVTRIFRGRATDKAMEITLTESAKNDAINAIEGGKAV